MQDTASQNPLTLGYAPAAVVRSPVDRHRRVRGLSTETDLTLLSLILPDFLGIFRFLMSVI